MFFLTNPNQSHNNAEAFMNGRAETVKNVIFRDLRIYMYIYISKKVPIAIFMEKNQHND